MNRNGYALLTVLWLVVLLGAVTTESARIARVDAAESFNRVQEVRNLWAARACFAILEARAAGGRFRSGLDSVSLGTGLWCRAVVRTPKPRSGEEHRARAVDIELTGLSGTRTAGFKATVLPADGRLAVLTQEVP